MIGWRMVGFYIVLAVVGLAGAAGDISLYRWAKSSRLGWLAFGMASWIVSLLLFALLLRHGERSLGATFVLAAVIHVGVVLGWEWFRGESNTSTLLWVGLVMAAVGIVLIELGHYWGGSSE
jgi:hypothetical protein